MIEEVVQMTAVKFSIWLEDNHWTAVYSKELNKRAYVDSSKHKILIHGNDQHYTNLISKHGKDLNELYEAFIKSERERINTPTP